MCADSSSTTVDREETLFFKKLPMAHIRLFQYEGTLLMEQHKEEFERILPFGSKDANTQKDYVSFEFYFHKFSGFAAAKTLARGLERGR